MTRQRGYVGIGALVARIEAEMHAIRPRLERAREVLAFAAQRGRDVRLVQVASSLTFTTVLSLVPLVAVILAVFTAFPLFGEFRGGLEKLLLKTMLPEQFSQTILRYLNDFAGKATKVGAAGVAFVAVTALMMILTVDRVLNDIWQVHRRRSLTQRLLVYWGLLTVGPILIGASLTLTSYVMTASAGWIGPLPAPVSGVLSLLPFVLSGFAYAALYVLVPNRRVQWHDALIGGFIAALLTEALGRGFSAYITRGTFTTIYGAFAVVPIFLTWIYFSWLIILFGATIAATLPMLRTTRFADQARAGNEFLTAVALLIALVRAPRRANGAATPMTTRELARDVRTFEEETLRLLLELERLGYVGQLSHAGADGGPAWLLVCDPKITTTAAAFNRFGIDPASSLAQREATAFGGWVSRAGQADWLSVPLGELARD